MMRLARLENNAKLVGVRLRGPAPSLASPDITNESVRARPREGDAHKVSDNHCAMKMKKLPRAEDSRKHRPFPAADLW